MATQRKTEFSNLTVGIKEAAEFLGFQNTISLVRKVKCGIIPGCKPGREWVFLKEDLVNYLRNEYNNYKTSQNGKEICQSIKEKALPITGSASRLKAIECSNLLRQLREKKPKE